MTLPSPPPPLPYFAPQPAFRGRKGGLIAFGILLVILGAFFALSAAAVPLMLLLARQAPPGTAPQQDPRSLVMGAITYTALAVLFVATGIGSIRCRRWVRPIMRILAWTWLVTGVLSTAIMLVMLPQIAAVPAPPGPAGAALSPGALYAIFAVFLLLILSIFYIALPALLLWFYRRADVQQTLDHFDPGPAWTDRCPTPVLGLSLGMWVTAAFTLTALLYNVTPFFGLLLTGPAAAIVILLTALVAAAAGWTTFQCRPLGWWISTLFILAATASAMLTFLRHDLTDFYATSLRPEQLDAFRSMTAGQELVLFLSIPLVGIACLAYMLYVRKHFHISADKPAVAMVQPRASKT